MDEYCIFFKGIIFKEKGVLVAFLLSYSMKMLDKNLAYSFIRSFIHQLICQQVRSCWNSLVLLGYQIYIKGIALGS